MWRGEAGGGDVWERGPVPVLDLVANFMVKYMRWIGRDSIISVAFFFFFSRY